MDLGETLRFSSDLRDQTDALANASAVALTIVLPDGTSVTPSVTNPPATTGKYFVDYTPTIAGRFVGSWAFTLSGGNTASYVETFDVGSSLVTVDEALAHLRAAGVITGSPDLDELQWLCFVATDAVEKDLGLVLARRSITSTFDGGCSQLRLQAPPRAADGGSITITAVTENGTSLTDGYVLRKLGWRLVRGSTLSVSRWASGIENISVTYTAGCVDPPRCVRFAALGEIQLAWQSSQQASHPLMDDFSPEPAIAAGAPPHLASAMLRAYNSLRTLSFA